MKLITPKKRVSWELEKINFQSMIKFLRNGTLFLDPKCGFNLHSGDTLQHLKSD